MTKKKNQLAAKKNQSTPLDTSTEVAMVIIAEAITASTICPYGEIKSVGESRPPSSLSMAEVENDLGSFFSKSVAKGELHIGWTMLDTFLCRTHHFQLMLAQGHNTIVVTAFQTPLAGRFHARVAGSLELIHPLPGSSDHLRQCNDIGVDIMNANPEYLRDSYVPTSRYFQLQNLPSRTVN